ncbi:MAG TPA: FHA domain-containing protein, partial [Tepidisphaeraceae bacterium]|nr:FHA domain-containing protein [Tepidisphaeraceae bacterium]
MPQSLASDSMHPTGKLPPTLTPTGQFAGKPTLPISRSVTLIGSRKQARLQLISSSVSQNHALIINADNGPYIRDLASRSHVAVNGRQVREGPLRDGDEIQIGRFTFRFNESPQSAADRARQYPAASAARFAVDGADLPVPFDGRSMLIGRRETCDVHLLEESVSTVHAIVFEMDGRRYVRDLASRTGTFVNGKQVHQVELMPGDEIKVGDTAMRYVADGSPGVTADEMAPVELGAAPEDLVDLNEPLAPVAPPPAPRRAPPARIAPAAAAAAAA